MDLSEGRSGSEDCRVGGVAGSEDCEVVGSEDCGVRGHVESIVCGGIESCRHGGILHMNMLQKTIEDRRTYLQSWSAGMRQMYSDSNFG